VLERRKNGGAAGGMWKVRGGGAEKCDWGKGDCWEWAIGMTSETTVVNIRLNVGIMVNSESFRFKDFLKCGKDYVFTQWVL